MTTPSTIGIALEWSRNKRGTPLAPRASCIRRAICLLLVTVCLLGCGRGAGKIASLPTPSQLGWQSWWSDAQVQLGLPSQQVSIHRLDVAYDAAGDVRTVDMEAEETGKTPLRLFLHYEAGQHQITLRHQHGSFNDRLISPEMFWRRIEGLPREAWPPPGGQLHVAPAHPHVQYQPGGYKLAREDRGKWVEIPAGGAYTSSDADWEVTTTDAQAAGVAHWLWTDSNADTAR